MRRLAKPLYWKIRYRGFESRPHRHRGPAMTTPLRVTLVAALLLAAACAVDRRFKIVTEPPGADVTVDGKYLGESPLVLHFAHYGDRRIRISKRGFSTIERVVPIDAPWYGAFPFDVVSEVLIPVWRTDFRETDFVLTPRTEAAGLTEAALLREEAEALAHARALNTWVPGDPLPATAPPRTTNGSSPAPPASRPAESKP